MYRVSLNQHLAEQVFYNVGCKFSNKKVQHRRSTIYFLINFLDNFLQPVSLFVSNYLEKKKTQYSFK